MCSKKLTTEEFIERSNKIHNGKYDYSKSKYTYCHTYIKIICPIHGLFMQRPDHHMDGHGCDKCARELLAFNKILKMDEFIKIATSVHGNKYDYSLAVLSKRHSNIKIICPVHGIFEQEIHRHLNGCGCAKCGWESMSKKRKITIEQFIEKSNLIHENKYSYDLVCEIENNNHKIKIICPVHGIFIQSVNYHLMGRGCNRCAIEKNADKLKLTFDCFIKKAKKIHSDRYVYDELFFKNYYKNNYSKIKITCFVHGVFYQYAYHHLSGCGCPKCGFSKGEDRISQWMDKNGIKYDYDKKFNDCVNPKTNRKLQFDFYIKEYNVVIEYDGKQHYDKNAYGFKITNNAFKNGKYRDELKNKYCKKNKIKLIRIPYWDFNNIEKILNKKLLGIK